MMEADAAKPMETIPEESTQGDDDVVAPPPQEEPVAPSPITAVELQPEIASIPETVPSTTHAREEEEDVEMMERPAKRARVSEVLVAVEIPAQVEPTVEVVQTPQVDVIELEGAIEEEEPPEYNFEPEVVDLSASDLYLDTVRMLLLIASQCRA